MLGHPAHNGLPDGFFIGEVPKQCALGQLHALEIAFLFPWAVALHDVGFAGFIGVVIFLAILVVGFIYEWKKGALDWE